MQTLLTFLMLTQYAFQAWVLVFDTCHSLGHALSLFYFGSFEVLSQNRHSREITSFSLLLSWLLGLVTLRNLLLLDLRLIFLITVRWQSAIRNHYRLNRSLDAIVIEPILRCHLDFKVNRRCRISSILDLELLVVFMRYVAGITHALTPAFLWEYRRNYRLKSKFKVTLSHFEVLLFLIYIWLPFVDHFLQLPHRSQKPLC